MRPTSAGSDVAPLLILLGLVGGCHGEEVVLELVYEVQHKLHLEAQRAQGSAAVAVAAVVAGGGGERGTRIK